MVSFRKVVYLGLGEILTPAPSGVMTENDPGTDCGHALNVGRKVGRV